jgi:hypothetical protein
MFGVCDTHGRNDKYTQFSRKALWENYYFEEHEIKGKGILENIRCPSSVTLLQVRSVILPRF